MSGLYSAKGWFTSKLSYFVKLAVRKNLSPNLFTFIGVLGGALTAYSLLENLWPLVAVGLVVRLAGANLDGAVARAQSKANPLGFIINEVGDRLADFIIISMLVVLGYRSLSPLATYVAVAATITASLPTLVSVSAAASGGSRLNGGPLGKTERCACILILSLLLSFGANQVWSLCAVGGVIILGSAATALLRARTYHTILTSPDKEGK